MPPEMPQFRRIRRSNRCGQSHHRDPGRENWSGLPRATSRGPAPSHVEGPWPEPRRGALSPDPVPGYNPPNPGPLRHAVAPLEFQEHV